MYKYTLRSQILSGFLPFTKRKLKTSERFTRDEEEFYVEEVCDHVFVGNRRGLDVAG